MIRKIIIIATLIIILSSHTYADDLLEFYNYNNQNIHYELRLTEESSYYLKYQLCFTSPVKTPYPENNTAYCLYYQPKSTTKTAAIIVLHTYRTKHARIEQYLCKKLIQNGLTAVLLTLPYHLKRKPTGLRRGKYMVSSNIERVIEAHKQAIIDLRCTLDFLETRPNIDTNRIGIIGISLGAILTNLAMGVDSRLKAGVSILGGGNLSKLIWRSIATLPIKYELITQGWTKEKLQQKLQIIDPITFAHYNQPRNVYMINGSLDLIMPKSCVKDLWHALGKPKITWTFSNHYTLLLIKPKIIQKSIDFLKKQLH